MYKLHIPSLPTAPSPITVSGSFAAFLLNVLILAAIATFLTRQRTEGELTRLTRTILVIMLAGIIGTLPLIKVLGQLVVTLIGAIIGLFTQDNAARQAWTLPITLVIVLLALGYYRGDRFKSHHVLMRFFALTVALSSVFQTAFMQGVLDRYVDLLAVGLGWINTAWITFEGLHFAGA